MDIHKAFHMKGGVGDNSYSKNSSLQKRVAERLKHITAWAIEEVFMSEKPKSLGMADLGCSSGPNALSNIKQVVEAVEKASRRMREAPPEFRVYLNDLHSNDFNTIFQGLPDLYRDLKRGGTNQPPLYIAACPGTFYGRLFPDHSLHFVYSSNSLHWLSTVPAGIYEKEGRSMNRKSIYISERSPPVVRKAYLEQFQHDFSLFLKSRSQELIRGGRMLLILLGRTLSDHAHCANSFLWELLYQSLAHLVAQGEIEEEKLESYDVHFYAPSKAELEDEVRKEGSFKTEMVEMVEMRDEDVSGSAVAKAVRSIQESMLAHHFGFGEPIFDKLFHHYALLIDREFAQRHVKSTTALLLLTKL
ncbi:probable methyltransferase TCM_000336 [Salvia miltiorrhiza]|uniref:probable methyltransferase TCM_000336 n=1 Tax=Salvia miltiorrhiza TaxID=226208 RepID=UPI0025AD2F6B|nr:probable methyltransferase TCM_000336 [Salvia miltiorrhiza]XP_057806880.1 probable methyltransferase TCM_000336 [Salvia miltiorrhiza]